MHSPRAHCAFFFFAVVLFIANTVHCAEPIDKSASTSIGATTPSLVAVKPQILPTGVGSTTPSSSLKSTWRLPAFIALGIGGLGAGGAIVTEIVGSGRHDDPKLDCGTHCGPGHDGDHSLALATKVLAGIGAAGVGTGLVLMLTSPRKEAPALTPSFKFNFSGTKVTAKAVWRF
jgi:hypothetical protein